MYKYVLFDLDGTITDPKEGIVNALLYMFNKYNMKIENVKDLYKLIGPPLTESFQKYYGFSKEKSLEAVLFYREYYKDKGVNENTLYEGVYTTIKTLYEKGYVIGLATSKPEVFAKHILDTFDLSKYFKVIAGATMDDSRSKKADVITYALNQLDITSLDEVIMVGDRMYDIIGAKENNIDSIGVLYGYGNIEELKEVGATYIVSKPEDIIDLLATK